MENCCETKKFPLTKVLLWAWAVAATAFIAWQYLNAAVYQAGVANGQQSALAQLVQAASAQESCAKGVTIGQTTLINVACLQKPADAPAKAGK